MKKIRTLLSYVKPYSFQVALNIFFNLLGIIFGLCSLLMSAPFLGILFGTQPLVTDAVPFEFSTDALKSNFDYFLSSIIIEHGQKEALFIICILVVALFFLKNLFIFLANYYTAPIRSGIVKDIRNKVFRKILSLPLSYFTAARQGDIISRLSTDVQEIEWSIMSSIELVFRNPITIIIFMITLFYMSPSLTLFVLILLPLSAFIIGRIGKSLKRTSRLGQRNQGVLISVIEETLTGMRIIKAFNAENKIKRRFEHQNETLTQLMTKMARRRFLASPMSEFLGIVVMVVVMWFGGNLVLDSTNGTLSSQAFITYLIVFSQILSPAKSFSTAYFNINKGIASVERINEVLNADITIKESKNAVPITDFNSSIEYKGLWFKYENDDVLCDINLKIEKGKTIAIVGQSGAGKSTLADLLPRFYDPTAGEILIDGKPIKDYKIADLRNLMGIVSQESILFNDTFFNNIAFGDISSTEEQVIAASKVANAHEFINTNKNGYYFNIGDKGGKLSGGQRQRVSIARAVLKNPPILILDEATSSLDTESEKLVQDALYKLMENRTSIVIAHRLSTVQHADEIIVLHEGRIVERGTHTNLLNVEGYYKKLYDMQMFS